MSYKTILVHVDQSRHAAARIRIAAEIALAENAHLIGSAMTGISRIMYQDAAVDMAWTVVAAELDNLKEQAEKALTEFDAIAQQMGVLSYEKRLVNDEPGDALSLQGRYSDLVVISQTDVDETCSRVISGMPEYVMLNCGRPVLIVPYAGEFKHIGNNVLVTWDGSMEATRALTNAIPMLKRAKNVAVALFNPSVQFNAHGEQPGADIALYLARHKIKVDVLQEVTEMDVGNTLLSLAADLRSDLIVMGGYGHTRFREVLLGGVTKTVLKTMTIPVLMSH
ncbi:universal stress protein [Glaciimonas sp. PCH181]|uniref:universal stress protein n=1 Tax=Glaciimonas sp. PCH181 TaxID=2133943 RepID=UPI000D3CF69C|nr:universal stress protein [Glaciimonas sp. PCH181]PUA19466.1 universal stress protein [Glaciimonas sp. PCH181]